MDHDVQRATNLVEKKVEQEEKNEKVRGQLWKQGLMKMDTQELKNEKMNVSKPNEITKIQAQERVRKTSSDLRREIIDLGGAGNLTELRKKRKSRKKRVTPPVERESAEQEIMGPVEVSVFLQAAVQGKIKVVENFLENGGNPDSCDEFRRTALHRASLEGHYDIVQKLLDQGADVNFRDRLDCSALHWACRGGRLEVVKILQSRGADLNVKDKLMSTPLHVATRTGHYHVVEHLISSGIKINSKDREGDTALHDAVRLNRYRIVKMLTLHGADMKARNIEGKTPTDLVLQWQFDTKDALERLEPRTYCTQEDKA
ncbi:ankyrin repeat domain-containing protein 2 [Lepisosteus oculatus]|uniref:ankyrin repeat domain-containing protein 2 n=1 Tax=Lepisosteus oculatus TaxID=7918 RepID=UPI00371CC91F